MDVRYKLTETSWNVLQNEDEHRVLGNADTKYDALITHIWALKTTQNYNFTALFTKCVIRLSNTIWTQVC